MLEVEDGSALAQVRIVEHLGGVQHRPARDAASREGPHDLVLRVGVNFTRVMLRTASCIATSTSWPRPVACRWTRAARIAMVRCIPVPASPMFAPLTTGGRSG